MTEGIASQNTTSPNNARGPPGLLATSKAAWNDKVKFTQGGRQPVFRCVPPAPDADFHGFLTEKGNSACLLIFRLISKLAQKLLQGSFLQRTPLERPSLGRCSTCLSHQDRWTLAVALGKAAGCWHGPSALLTGYRVQVTCGKLPAQALIN